MLVAFTAVYVVFYLFIKIYFLTLPLRCLPTSAASSPPAIHSLHTKTFPLPCFDGSFHPIFRTPYLPGKRNILGFVYNFLSFLHVPCNSATIHSLVQLYFKRVAYLPPSSISTFHPVSGPLRTKKKKSLSY